MSEQIETGPNSAKQSIEELQKRYQKLNTRKIQAETNLENAKTQLERLRQDARENYGTDDVAELREKLDAMTAENEEKRSKYQVDLDRIEAELQAVEQTFAASENPPAGQEENS
jgi:chromosome segregation ATPase